MIQIGIKFINDVAILEVSGGLSGGFETSILHSRVKELIADDISNIIIDLKHSRLINSIAIGVLLGCYTSVSRENGNIKLANVSEKVNRVLEITHLAPFLRTYQTVREALTSFETRAENKISCAHDHPGILENHRSESYC